MVNLRFSRHEYPLETVRYCAIAFENNCAFRGGKSIGFRRDTKIGDAADCNVVVCSYYTIFCSLSAPYNMANAVQENAEPWRRGRARGSER